MTDHRDGRVVCPECGASCFVTDDRCVECGFDFLSARPVPLRDEDAAAQRYLDYGRAALAAGRSRQALSYFDRACALAPRRAGAHLARAQALRALGDVEGAFGECGVALELDPAVPEVAGAYIDTAIALANVYASGGHWEQALQVIDAARGRFPGNQDLARVRAGVTRSWREATARREGLTADSAAAGTGAAVGAGAGAAAGASVGLMGIVGGVLVCCLALALVAGGVALCLTCVGALIGVPLILAAAGLFMAGVGIATGSPIAGLAVFGGMAGTGGLAGWLSRRARPRHPRP